MRRRHALLPRFWLMTDERMGDGVLAAINRLPRGRAGVIFRHYRTPLAERRALFEAVRRITQRRRLMLLLADPPGRARRARADGWHGRGRDPGLIHSMAVHNKHELTAAIRARANLIFVSPVFPTRSHPGTAALGVIQFGLLARDAPMPVIALGGMTAARWRRLRSMGAYGYAAIDAWTGQQPYCASGQKLNDVPT